MTSLDGRNDTASKRRDAQRAALLDAASDMLMRGGPDALSLRKIAAKVGTSTMAVYTAFGGKEGLVAALFEEAFDRLADAEFAVERPADPLLWLGGLGQAYRRFAIENPSYYALMISVTMPVSAALRHDQPADGETPARNISRHPSFQILIDAIEACIAEGSFSADADALVIADALWATTHGHCSLELAGFYASAETAEARFASASTAVLKGFLSPKGLEKLRSRPDPNLSC
nr:TetR family transcriptional regulator [Aerococcus tenax]